MTMIDWRAHKTLMMVGAIFTALLLSGILSEVGLELGKSFFGISLDWVAVGIQVYIWYVLWAKLVA